MSLAGRTVTSAVKPGRQWLEMTPLGMRRYAEAMTERDSTAIGGHCKASLIYR